MQRGGYGGVGGAGEGPPATPVQIGVLNGTATPDPLVAFLYPYDKTVFPQALLPPLLQWSYGTHSFDGVYIHITEMYFEYKGYFRARRRGRRRSRTTPCRRRCGTRWRIRTPAKP